MVFSSTVFVFFFLPLCLLLYYLLPGIRLKNLILLLFSLVFYAWGEPVYIVLMLLSILTNYLLGLFIEQIPSWRKFILVMGVILNLAVLGFFKYYGFAVGILNELTGWQLEAHTLPLPIGISFYTFQALSYVIDLYRGKIGVQKDPFRFALYISMFPQLIAGPIVRYATVETQLTERKITADGLGRGMARFIFGLSKKVLLANPLGAVFEKSALNTAAVSGLSAWIGLIAFSFQIYFDFSGYSDMAIGMGQMLGFEFPENFNTPYASLSVTDFWRRWHMTLGTWFREYVYIPLGGNQKGALRHVLNILIVWGLTGLWHGAAWNFVLWGLYYGILLLFEKYILFRWSGRPRIIGHLLTIPAVFLGWGLFLCNSMQEVKQTFSNLFGLTGLSFSDTASLRLLVSEGAVLLISAILCFPVFQRGRDSLIQKHQELMAVICLFLLALCTAFLVTQNYNPFLYFRF